MATVKLINLFEITSDQKQACIKYWESAADFMRQQPGFVSTELH